MNISLKIPSFNELLNISFVIYAFMLPLSVTYTLHTGPYIILALWILSNDFRKKSKILYEDKSMIFLAGFVVVSAVSILWTSDENIHHGVKVLKQYFVFLILYITITTSLQKKYIQKIIYSFLSAMFISEITSYGIYFGYWLTKKGTPSDPTPFLHHSHYALMLSVTILLLIYQLLKKSPKTNTDKIIYIFEIVFLMTATTNLFVNGGRMGQLIFLISTSIFLIYYYRKALSRFFISVVLLVLVVFVAYIFSPVFHTRVEQGINDLSKITQGDYNSSFGIRYALKKIIIINKEKVPILGYGIGDDLEWHSFVSSEDNEFKPIENIGHLHDQYLQIYMQTGAIGLFFYISFILTISRSYTDDPLNKSLLYSIVSSFILAAGIDLMFYSALGPFFGFMIPFVKMICQTDSKQTLKRS